MTRPDTLIDTLIGWSEINSGSGNLEGLARMADVLEAAFATLAPDVAERRKLDGGETVGADGVVRPRAVGDALLFRKRLDAPRRVLLCIHYDTVFAAGHPFQACRFLDDDTLNGPGVADAKGGILVILEALKRLEADPNAAHLGWDVLLNPDEEISSPGSAPMLDAAVRHVDYGLLYEPSMPDGTLAGQRKGTGNFDLVIEGRAAHVGRNFPDGRSAIVAAARFVTAMHDLNGKVGTAIFSTGKIEGGGPSNVVPDKAVVRINIRVTDPAETDAAVRALEDLAAALNGDGIRAHLHGHVNRPPKLMEGRTARLYDWAKDVAAPLGIALNWVATGGCCDGNNLAAAGLPNIDSLGVIGGAIHSPDEYVTVSSIEPRIALTARLLTETAAGRGPFDQ